eukprot:c6662_g1_i3.p1 GENE.c6662_g1_i3~~c6662_g1_i3.p1  ORF type:complete len:202 (-),score=38.39 c6662_g1_i3:51-656(-)
MGALFAILRTEMTSALGLFTLFAFLTSITSARLYTSTKYKASYPIDSTQQLPRSRRSEDFSTLAKTPRSPQTPSQGSETQSLLQAVFNKLGDTPIPITSIKFPSKVSAATTTDDLEWIDQIKSTAALKQLHEQLETEIALAEKKLLRVRQAQRRLLGQTGNDVPAKSTAPKVVDITEQLFGTKADEMKEHGISVQVIFCNE